MPRPRTPAEHASRQLARDLANTRRFPRLRPVKLAKMTESPHGFLRGSSPAFYELLRERPSLARGPAGEGMLAGDVHLENVGVYRTDADDLVFGLNDLDDAAPGPWRWDVLRLLTSVLLCGRHFRASSRESAGIAEHAAHGWALGAFGGRDGAPSAAIRRMLDGARRRSPSRFLDERAPRGKDGRRRFVRGSRYFELPRSVKARVPAMLRSWVEALGPRAPASAGSFRVGDAAFRVAGNGSLGRLRLAILVEASDHERLVEVKEARPSPLGGGARSPPVRVVEAARLLGSAPQKQLAALRDGRHYGRRLMPQEDKLDLHRLRPGPELDGVARQVGRVLGEAHARAARSRPKAWSDRALAGMVDRAVEMAGLHEAMYLAYGRIAPGTGKTAPRRR